MCPMRRVVVSSLLGLLLPLAAQAQSNPAGTPVDQAVGDLDPLSRSLRRIEPGNAQFDYDSAMRRFDDNSPYARMGGDWRYVYEAPGMRALISRPDYIVVRPDEPDGRARNKTPGIDGGFKPVIPPNTVFDLTPRPTTRVVRPEDDPNWVDRRVDTRLAPVRPVMLGRVDSRGTVERGNIDLPPRQVIQPRAGLPRELPPEALQPQREAPTETAEEPAEAPAPEPAADETAEAPRGE